jgi:hypothetical protein
MLFFAKTDFHVSAPNEPKIIPLTARPMNIDGIRHNLMEFSLVSPYQLKERLEKPILERLRNKKPAGTRSRRIGLNCYLPLGDSNLRASHRITGAHLDPDGPEMLHAAMTYAGTLLDALGHGSVGKRILIGPARYGDKVLTKYCETLIKAALGERTLDLVSPLLVSYLLGGIPISTLEELAWKAMDLMDFFPEPYVPTPLARALPIVGFGAQFPHLHVDECYDSSYEEPGKKYAHLSLKQQYLLELPAAESYARLLINQGAYPATLRRTLTAMKLAVMAEATRLMDPEGGEMTEYAAQGRRPVLVDDIIFSRAVRRVFEKPWLELDLSGRNEDRISDAEVVTARLIIQRLNHKVLKSSKLSAVTLVGMSLLTGISVANWAEFAVYDLKRRGETFLTAETLDEVVEMLQVSPYFTCEQQLRGAATDLRYADLGKAKWARRLQSPNRPLWSGPGTFYVSGLNGKGLPVYRHKPFSLSSD